MKHPIAIKLKAKQKMKHPIVKQILKQTNKIVFFIPRDDCYLGYIKHFPKKP